MKSYRFVNFAFDVFFIIVLFFIVALIAGSLPPKSGIQISTSAISNHNLENEISQIRVIDGDTIHAEVALGFGVFLREPIRILGINAPEIRTSDPEEKNRGLESKKFVEKELQKAAKTVLLSDGKRDKFGRLLGDIGYFYGDEYKTLAAELLARNLAVEYTP
jgi:endonuclease YncB( thermonuclease family)